MGVQSKKILLITGEASGDHHGALVVKALKKIDDSVSVYGIGGEELSKAGMELLYHSRDLSVLGFSEVFLYAGRILKAFRRIKKEIRRAPPALLLLIDYPEFNLRIAEFAKKLKVPVLYYISPQIWAWRKGRTKKIARIVDKMAVIFPFEVRLYEKENLDVSFVGHPLLDQDMKLMDRPAALNFFGLKEDRPIIGLLPGSRKIEIHRLLPPMLEALNLISNEFPSSQFILPVAPGINQKHVQEQASRQRVPVKVVGNNFYQAIDVCDLVLVASGTATLETAIMKKPMLILYKVSFATYLIGKILIHIPYIGLANIVAGKEVVPELIQGDVTPERIAAETASILRDRKRMEAMQAELCYVKEALGEKGASQKVAGLAYDFIGNSRS